MPKRLHKTTGDYLAIAIGPALIMVLVWSLIAFLLEVFYQGEYSARLKLIMFMFVFGAVLIGRIAIEEGRQRAGLFAVALGVVTALALWRFSEPHGGALSTVALLGLIWWCAYKLVWDCTLIDDEQDASGEGLLATMGWEGDTGPPHGGSASGADTVRQAANGTQDAEHRTSNIERPKSNRKPHAPGKWVIYFSLAALPVFGIGQLFIPQDDLERRQFALRLMAQYVAAGMGLLLTTSFLGLRRYLRQRHVQMPTKMAGGWMGAGAALIAAVLLFCLLIPRPDAELAISSITGDVGSDFQTSPRAIGTDGPLRKEGDRSRTSDDPNAKGGGGNQKNSKPGGSGSGDQDQGQGKGNSDSKGQGSSQSGDKNGSQSGNQSGDGESNDSSKSGNSGGQEQDSGEDSQSGDEGESNDESQEDQKSDQGEEQQGGGSSSSQGESQSSESRSGSRSSESQTRSSRSSDDSSRTSSWSPARWFGNTVKWIFYAVLIVLGVFLAWRYRREIAAAWRQFVEDFKNFWSGLFGGKRKEQAETSTALSHSEAAHTHRVFADYPNPFLSGAAGRHKPEEVVAYSFRALEAWGREHGAARQPEETPSEFAQNIGQAADCLADDARRLAALYSQVAYAPGTLDGRQVETLRPLWRGMENAH